MHHVLGSNADRATCAGTCHGLQKNSSHLALVCRDMLVQLTRDRILGVVKSSLPS